MWQEVLKKEVKTKKPHPLIQPNLPNVHMVDGLISTSVLLFHIFDVTRFQVDLLHKLLCLRVAFSHPLGTQRQQQSKCPIFLTGTHWISKNLNFPFWRFPLLKVHINNFLAYTFHGSAFPFAVLIATSSGKITSWQCPTFGNWSSSIYIFISFTARLTLEFEKNLNCEDFNSCLHWLQ